MTIQDNFAPLILFVDDEATAVKYFKQALEPLAKVIAAGSVEEGRRMLDEHAQSLMVLVSDQRMPGGYGNELLQYARVNHPHIVRILTTAYSELEHTIEAVNQGQIHRYIQKPWEISALRAEMKQALDLAALRKEHAQLLREKMIVRQQQLLSSRIGALHALCVSLAGPGNFLPVETYLSAAAIAGVKPLEPDWLLQDYADLIEAEAQRSGKFGYDVRNRLAEIRQRYHDRPDGDEFALLPEILGGGVQFPVAGTALFPDERSFAEFLETSSAKEVSPQHVSWLALLIYLHERGDSLQLAKQADGIHCCLGKSAVPAATVHLAEWVGRFCEADDGMALSGMG